MNILIIGKSGTGKSNLGDIIKTAIFKVDKDAKIETNDPGRSIKVFGSGNTLYQINMKQYDNTLPYLIVQEDVNNYDVIVIMINNNFYTWFKTIYNK